MIRSTTRSRLAIATAAGAVLALTSTSVSAADACRVAAGKVQLAPVSGPECLSPVGLCFAGELTGGLTGTAFTTATSITPTVDTPQTTVVLFTADAVIGTRHGDLELKDAVLFQSAGAGEFSELSTFVGGTGDWEGASGVFRAEGTFDGTTVDGKYRAEVCQS